MRMSYTLTNETSPLTSSTIIWKKRLSSFRALGRTQNETQLPWYSLCSTLPQTFSSLIFIDNLHQIIWNRVLLPGHRHYRDARLSWRLRIALNLLHHLRLLQAFDMFDIALWPNTTCTSLWKLLDKRLIIVFVLLTIDPTITKRFIERFFIRKRFQTRILLEKTNPDPLLVYDFWTATYEIRLVDLKVMISLWFGLWFS